MNAPRPTAPTAQRTKVAACPVCAAPAKPEHRPFCSPRCAQVDLHRWFSGAYVLPGAAAPTAEPADED